MWHYRTRSNFTAVLLDFFQMRCILEVLVKAALQAPKIPRHHWSIVKLRKSVFVREFLLPPFCPIMSKISFGLSFEERVFLPSATWEALIFLDLANHFSWLDLKFSAAIWRVFKGLLSQCPVRELFQFHNLTCLVSYIRLDLIILSQRWSYSMGAALQRWKNENMWMVVALLISIDNPVDSTLHYEIDPR